jgi:hypothetical protein
MKRLLAVLAFAAASTAGAAAQTQPPALAAAAAAYAKIAGYRTTAHVYQVQGTDAQNNVYEYAFTKPSTIAVTIASGPNAGNSVTWTGGTSLRANGGRTIDLTDPMVLSLRGVTIVQLSFGAILQHAQETAGTLTSAAATLSGTTVNLVNLDVANPRGDAGLTREVLYLSQATNLPVRLDGFVGTQLVQTVSFDHTTTN